MRVERVKGPLRVDTVRDLTQGARLGGILIICNILLTNSCLIYINMIILTFLIFVFYLSFSVEIRKCLCYLRSY